MVGDEALRITMLALEAAGRGVAREACTVAALISERDIRAGRVTFAGLDSGTAISGIAGGAPNPNAISAASPVEEGATAVKSWDNGVDPATGVAPFKDGRVITLLVF